MTRAPRAFGLVVVLAVAGLPGGCSPGRPSAGVLVQRDTVGPGQVTRTIDMKGRSAFYATGSDGWCRVLLGFPPAGSVAGRPAYYLYLRYRPLEGPHPITAGGGEQGLWMQASRVVGEPFDVTMVSGGRIDLTRSGQWYRMAGRFDLLCSDGQKLTGRFNAVLNPQEVEKFEKAYLKTAASGRDAR